MEDDQEEDLSKRVTSDGHHLHIDATVRMMQPSTFAHFVRLRSVTFTSTTTLQEIPDLAFSNTAVQNICFPRSIERIGFGAFAKCRDLQSVQFAADSHITSLESMAFAHCSSLCGTFDIPGSVSLLGFSVFAHTGIDTVEIAPGELTQSRGEIHPSTWSNMPEFRQVTLTATLVPKDDKDITEECHRQLQLPEHVSVTCTPSQPVSEDGTLWVRAKTVRPSDVRYARKTGAVRLMFGAEVESILPGAFRDWSTLRTVRFEDTAERPSHLRHIGAYAFFNGSGLCSVHFPRSTETIGFAAFFNCQHLADVRLNHELLHIGRAAFACCGLGYLSLPPSLTSIGEDAFATSLCRTTYGNVAVRIIES